MYIYIKTEQFHLLHFPDEKSSQVSELTDSEGSMRGIRMRLSKSPFCDECCFKY